MLMQYDVPIVFITFRRKDKSLEVLSRIRQVQPRKLYLLSDAGRNEEEQLLVDECRAALEQAVDWPCELIKLYTDKNKGCYGQIGLGAIEIFKIEKTAIFLEDDNLPEVSFFYFCNELLEKYKDDDRIMWICGTNYLERYEPEDDIDYIFTQHMLPCGWASWSHKFIKYYDGEFKGLTQKNLCEIKKKYVNKRLFKRDKENWEKELYFLKTEERFRSWDYQMCFSIRLHDKLGIVPVVNQIRNIGVDNFSEHGGDSFNSIMTKRFCGMNSYPLIFPLKHPSTVIIDNQFEKLTDKIVIPPMQPIRKIRMICSVLVRKFLRVPNDISIIEFIKKRISY